MIDRHKIRVDAGLHGKMTRIYLDDVEMTDVYAFDFRVDAESLTMATITMAADVELSGTLLSEYFEVRLKQKLKPSLWERIAIWRHARSRAATES